MTGRDADILGHVRTQFGTSPPARLGVAVSGGGDSIALLHILSRCFDPGSVNLFAVTVDHGLRADAAAEAQTVAKLAEQLYIPHTTLRWSGYDGTGNLQERARDARYALISEWAKTQDIAVLAVGHTADDQAETLLMRMARSSGVDGLSAMPVRRTMFGINVMRPLLGLMREDLRLYLKSHNISWVEDPSNEDPVFERIKTREALKALAPLGLTAPVLAGVAANMAQAREALDWYCFLTAREIATVDGGNVAIDLRRFRALPEEIARRLLFRSISWVGGLVHGPRRAPMALALESVRAGNPLTLGGCHIVRHDNRIWVCREHKAVQNECTPPDQLWDRRWRVSGPPASGVMVRALGQKGLMACPEWRAAGRPMAAQIATPSVWYEQEIVAAPLAGRADGWCAQLECGEEEFFASLLSH